MLARWYEADLWGYVMWRVIAAGVSAAVAAVTGMVTAIITTHASWALWVAFGTLVVVGGFLQAALTISQRDSSSQNSRAAGVISSRVNVGTVDGMVTGVEADHLPADRVEVHVKAKSVGKSGRVAGLSLRRHERP